MTSEYECDRCGACCRGTLIVEAYYLDALREPRILGADVTGRRTTIEELTDDDRCILLAANHPCRFLSADGCCPPFAERASHRWVRRCRWVPRGSTLGPSPARSCSCSRTAVPVVNVVIRRRRFMPRMLPGFVARPASN